MTTSGWIAIATFMLIQTGAIAFALGRLFQRVAAVEKNNDALTGLATAVPLFGSAVLGLAVHRGALTGQAAFDLSRLEEAFQEELWGVDADNAERTAC